MTDLMQPGSHYAYLLSNKHRSHRFRINGMRNHPWGLRIKVQNHNMHGTLLRFYLTLLNHHGRVSAHVLRSFALSADEFYLNTNDTGYYDPFTGVLQVRVQPDKVDDGWAVSIHSMARLLVYDPMLRDVKVV